MKKTSSGHPIEKSVEQVFNTFDQFV